MFKINLILVLFISACTPFVDARREAGKIMTVGQSSPQYLAICYSPFVDFNRVQILADQVCSKKAKFAEKKYFNCTLFNPNTAFFDCEVK